MDRASADAAAATGADTQTDDIRAAGDDGCSLPLRIAWWALLMAVFLVPLVTSNLSFLDEGLILTRDSVELVKLFALRALTLAALVAWAWQLLTRGALVRHTPVDWLVLAFLCWVGVTNVLALHWPVALFGQPQRHDGLLTFVTYAAVSFLTLQLTGSARSLRALAQVLCLSGSMVAAYGLVQYVGGDILAWGDLPFEAGRAFSTFGNPDFLGGFLVFSVPVALGLVLSEPRRLRRLVWWAGFGLNGLALVVTFTRGAWIGGAVAVLIVAVVAARRGTRLARVDALAATVGALLTGAVVWRGLASGRKVLNLGERLSSIIDVGRGSAQTRTEIWRSALAAIGDRPITGYGADTFRLVFPRYKTAAYVRAAGGSSVADNAHSYPLHLAAGVGVVGAALFYGIFIWAGVRSIRLIVGRTTDAEQAVRAAFWAAAAGYLVHLFFGMSVVGSSFLLWVALGVVLVPSARVVRVCAPRGGSAAALVALVVASLAVGLHVLPLLADHAALRASTASAAARTAAARQAVAYDPLNAAYKTDLGLAAADEMAGYLAAAARAQAQGGDARAYVVGFERSFNETVAAFAAAIAFQPDEYDNYAGLTKAYALGGRLMGEVYLDKALATAELGLELSPYATSVRFFRAQAYLGKGQTEEAIDTLRSLLAIDPQDGDAARALAGVYHELGRDGEALAALRAYEDATPGRQKGVRELIEQLEKGEPAEN